MMSSPLAIAAVMLGSMVLVVVLFIAREKWREP
jgi:hypothetical protein